MVAAMEVFFESAALLDSLRSSLREASAALDDLEVQTLTDLSANRTRDAGVWEFLSVACGSGGAATVAVRTIGLWIASTSTKIRIKVGQDEFLVEGRNAQAVLPMVAAALEAAQGHQTPAVDQAQDGPTGAADGR